jgi:K+-sensing histidine kinase KdpD
VQGLEKPRIVQGDAGRLEQVVFNLLLNASVAMKGRGRIVIRASCEEGDSPAVVLTVADDGPGIAPEHIEHIFDPFFTLGGGTGLGLSIVFGIVQAHGGTISAKNRAEGGAEFTLRFPAPLRTPQEQPRDHQDRRADRRRRTLRARLDGRPAARGGHARRDRVGRGRKRSTSWPRSASTSS